MKRYFYIQKDGVLERTPEWDKKINFCKENWKPGDDIVLSHAMFGDSTLIDIASDVKYATGLDEDAVEKEVVSNLDYYAKYDIPKIYTQIVDKAKKGQIQ